MIQQNFVKLYEETFKRNWSLPAFTNYEEGKSFTIADLSHWVAKVHIILERLGVEKGQKVALVGKDCAEWCMVWMGVTTYGAVLVPILPDFHAEDILHIINHSDSVMVFAGDEHHKYIDQEKLPNVHSVFDVKTLQPILSLSRSPIAQAFNVETLFKEKYPNGFTKEDIKYPEVSNNDLMLISYTSGTSGFSKGVMTTANNLAANVVATIEKEMQKKGDNLLCFLPNAHSYSLAFNVLLPLVSGAHVYILGQKPTPSVLMRALKDVQPGLILSVPLILEKIYKNVIAPKLKSKKAQIALKIPILKNVIYKKIRESLIDALGGNVHHVIVGGAALNEEVGEFLFKAKFPVTVGYGMTECAPLVTFSKSKDYVPGSVGKVMDRICEVRIADAKEMDGQLVGELQIRGENVCKGYYKNPEATDQLFTADGWMRSGDLGYFDKHNNIFLKGRSKAMILGANGQNIYPEEIEAKISMLPYMNEALVVERENNRIVAIVTIDRAALERDGYNSDDQINQLLQQNRKDLNQSLASFAQVRSFEVLEGDFENTPKQSIKRYLYS